MIIVVICACIVGGILWNAQSKIKKLEEMVKWYDTDTNKKIVLLAKDMLEMQTTVSKLKPKSKKHANTKVNRSK